MRWIPTRLHGVLDYLTGVFLIAMPFLFDFDRGGAETMVPIMLGVGAIAYSLLTDYELGAIRKLAVRTHLALDIASGLFLAASPWIFDFEEYVYLPHLVVGLFEVMTAMMTKATAEGSTYTRTHHGRPVVS